MKLYSIYFLFQVLIFSLILNEVNKFEFMKGKPGNYKISFSSNENTIKTLSSSFELINPIMSIELISNMSQKIEVKINFTILK